MANLTPAEKQDVIRFLEADKPLPDKYRFLLFEDKREVELVWNGKTSEVCNIVLPFQVIEQVDEPRVEKLDEQRSLPGMEPAQRNLLIWEEQGTGDYIFENEWQSFRTKQDRSLELTSAYREVADKKRVKIAVKVVDIFGNDTMTIVDVSVRK